MASGEPVEMVLKDLEDRYEGDLGEFTTDYLATKLADAEALILGECPTVPDRLASGALLVNNYKRIFADVILRVIRNPGGFASENEGGAGYSLTPVVASGNLWLTQQDIDLLNGVRRRGARIASTASIGLDSGWSR